VAPAGKPGIIRVDRSARRSGAEAAACGFVGADAPRRGGGVGVAGADFAGSIGWAVASCCPEPNTFPSKRL
jgi:hypothetical protein